MDFAKLIGAAAPQLAAPKGGAVLDCKSREIRRTAAMAVGGDTNALLKLYALDPALALRVEDEFTSAGVA